MVMFEESEHINTSQDKHSKDTLMSPGPRSWVTQVGMTTSPREQA